MRRRALAHTHASKYARARAHTHTDDTIITFSVPSLTVGRLITATHGYFRYIGLVSQAGAYIFIVLDVLCGCPGITIYCPPKHNYCVPTKT